jgi:hypothetical protein
MGFTATTLLICVLLFLGMMLLFEIGRHAGVLRLRRDADSKLGAGAIEGALFGLLGLMIAFTFYGAAARFDGRRQLIVEETNAIGTAYLRLDLLPADAQPALRDLFRRYVDSRLEVYRKLPDLKAAYKELENVGKLQKEIWTKAVAACRNNANPQATILLLPSLNQMIDITTTRTMTSKMHPPMIIFIMLAILALAGALMAGYGMAGGKARSWIHILGYALIMTLTIYVIFDLEYPRFGLIDVKAFDHVLVELHEGMK